MCCCLQTCTFGARKSETAGKCWKYWKNMYDREGKALRIFMDKKLEGVASYDWKMGTMTQELWDVMVVDVEKRKTEFIRFGAGEDRDISLLVLS